MTKLPEEGNGRLPSIFTLKRGFFWKEEKIALGRERGKLVIPILKKKEKKKQTIFTYVSHRLIFITIKKKEAQNQKYIVQYTTLR